MLSITPSRPGSSRGNGKMAGVLQLIECVANVSDSRPGVVRSIAGALAPCRLLDLHSDADHNRTVLTFAGSSDEVEAGVLRLFEAAVQRVDLRQHRGVHPRLGAVDVVPFVPLGGTPMAACLRLARRVGESVAERFALPVFLYEEAASAPHRRSLAAVRRGEFEGLAEKLKDPLWTPDFGPAAPHPSAGATAIGARRLLVAFNVDLDTADVAVARAIARTVRESSGGLPAVRAIGLYLATRRRAQVSMNLLDYERTSLATAFDAVRSEAGRRGVAVAGTELVGLVPQAAVPGDLASRLGIAETAVLERRLAAAGRAPSTPAGS